MHAGTLVFTALRELGEIAAGTDLAQTIVHALERQDLALSNGDVLVIAQKIVSKAEGRSVDLRMVAPSAEALRLAAVTGKDARLVEVVLSESEQVVRAVRNVLIVRHRLGYVMANAGVDRSNLGAGNEHCVLLLPRDPAGSAHALHSRLHELRRASTGIIISDSFGRPWRRGVVNVALASCGIPALIDRRGERDRDGRKLEVTEVALADAVAAGAGLVMGEAAEGTPVVLVRGVALEAPERSAAALLRPRDEDLFQ